MSGTKALLLAVVVVALALGNRLRPLDYLAIGLVVMVVVARIWSWGSVRGLTVARQLRPTRCHAGQAVEERLVLSSSLPLPRPWLEVRDRSTLEGHQVDRVLGMHLGGSRTWTVRTVCIRRGEYVVGPLTVIGTDPFGLFSASRQLPGSNRILVYPPTVDIPGFALPAISLPGGDQRQTGWHHVTPHASGIREYQPGDPLNRIHWLSTARTGRLMAKEFDLDPVSDVWLFLDMAREPQRGSGDESTEEYSVTIAASLARHFLDRGRAVGLVASGSRHRVIPSDRGDRQLLRILEELAVLRAEGQVPFAGVVTAESGRCSRRTAAVAITASLDEEWVTTLGVLRQRGVRTATILLEPDTFGVPRRTATAGQLEDDVVADGFGNGTRDNSLLIVGALAAAAIPVYLVKRGDRLQDVLQGKGSGVGNGTRRLPA